MKRISGLLVLVVLALMIVPVSAKSVSSQEMGVAYILSDSWVEVDRTEDAILYNHVNGKEFLEIDVVASDVAYAIEIADEAHLKDFCDDVYSDFELAQNLSDSNDALVSVHSDSVISSYEYYGHNQFYRYQKAYTARAYGYNDTPFYLTAFMTIKNGRIYIVEYRRNYEENHFEDIYSMLHSMTFELGEIKIMLNGKRVVSDSAPVIIDSRTLVPIRAVAEEMGYSVSWDASTEIVTLTSLNGDGTILHLEIGTDYILKNMHDNIPLDVAPMIIGSRTYLPLRAVAEAMNAEVGWEAETKTVIING